MATVYEAIGELEGLRALAHAWHERVLVHPIVGHAFEGGYHPDHTDRLARYWSEALGGPGLYTAAVADESTVVRMHSGNGEHPEMDAAAIECFDLALDDVGIARTDPLWSVMHDYFAWATNTTMTAYHESADDVPDGLTMPRWSWDGLVR